MNQQNRRNEDTTTDSTQSMFRERKQGDVPGYVNQISGGNEGQKGDDDANFVKEPPFTTDVVEIVSRFAVPVTGGGNNYVALPDVQCKQYRLLKVYLTYTMAVGGRLSVIPEASALGRWFATTLVGGTVTPFNPTGTRFPAGGFGSRPLEGAEFRTDALGAGTARFTVTFDVTDVEAFRLNVLDLSANAGNLLSVAYSLSV